MLLYGRQVWQIHSQHLSPHAYRNFNGPNASPSTAANPASNQPTTSADNPATSKLSHCCVKHRNATAPDTHHGATYSHPMAHLRLLHRSQQPLLHRSSGNCQQQQFWQPPAASSALMVPAGLYLHHRVMPLPKTCSPGSLRLEFVDLVAVGGHEARSMTQTCSKYKIQLIS